MSRSSEKWNLHLWHQGDTFQQDLIRKIRSKGRVDAENRWWFSELLVADFEKAWIHTGWEDSLQKWCNRLAEMKKGRVRKDGGNASAQAGAID